MKCSKCGKKIEETFLGKIKGTYVKKKPYCTECQKNLSSAKKDSAKKESEEK